MFIISKSTSNRCFVISEAAFETPYSTEPSGRTLPESLVTKIWQKYLPWQTELVTEDDGPIRIIYPGRPNDGRGADIRDAVIATRHGIRRGEIEIHVKSSSWWGHRHHQDPLYNGVILHVVYRRDVATKVMLQNGHKVPTLTLEKFVSVPLQEETNLLASSQENLLPCRGILNHHGLEFIQGILEAEGEKRFLQRAADLKAELCNIGAGQVLYREIMGALGYVKNKAPMLELANRVPLYRLEGIPRNLTDEQCLMWYQSWLIGAAGLMPSPSDVHFEPVSTDEKWRPALVSSWSTNIEPRVMTSREWQSFRVRPSGLPRRRLAAMSYLLLRYREKGLLHGLMDEFINLLPEVSHGDMESLLTVPASGYWQKYLDFDLPATIGVPALLGKNRAAIIIVNTLLPYIVAWSQVGNLPGLAEKALDLYRGYPSLEENTIVKHMKNQLGVSRLLTDTACRQQGLLHFYKNFCSLGKCGECILPPSPVNDFTL